MRMNDLSLEGAWTHTHYDTGEPYQVTEHVVIQDEGNLLLVCDQPPSFKCGRKLTRIK